MRFLDAYRRERIQRDDPDQNCVPELGADPPGGQGGRRGTSRQNRYSHVEENLADAIGLFILKEVGYNPYDAGAFFGRLQMFAGTTDPSTRIWKPYFSDHPFSEDRIENLRQVLARLQSVETSQPPQAPGYIWIGKFSVTVEGADGQRHVVETSDTLGIYTEDDFRVAQAMEVRARGEVIRRFLLQTRGGQIRRVLSVDLKAIERQVFDDQAEREKWTE